MWEKELYFVPVGNTKSGFGPNPERGILKFNTSENGEVPLELLGPKSLESSNGNYTTSWKDCEYEIGLDDYKTSS